MEHHAHLIELKAIQSANKLLILAVQKNQIAHECVLKLRRMAKAGIADGKAKEAELKELQAKFTELKADRDQLVKQVSIAKADKNKALAKKKDRYLRELAKLERKKDAKIKSFQKQMEDAEERGFKEGEELYV